MLLKKIIAMLLAVALVLLTACGTRYDLSAYLQPQKRSAPNGLPIRINAVLWEKLGLSGLVVSAGDPTAMTIGAQRWQLLQPATVNGEAVTLCFCLMSRIVRSWICGRPSA